MSELSYSFHIGNDKNKRKNSKNTVSGTSSLSNTAIQNANQLGKVNNHNLREYDNNKELITTLVGSSNLYKDVQDLYKKEFEQSRIEYNEKQKRSDRKIEDYFKKVSEDEKRDLACEIIIQIGDMDFWKNTTREYQCRMIEVFKEQLEDLVKLVPEFKLANCTIHFDESSPHLHVVGVPVKDGYTNGMKIQVAKSKTFTPESLHKYQKAMREFCINSFNKIYKTNYKLKGMEEGDNTDVAPKDMKDRDKIIIKTLKQEVKSCKSVIAKQKEEIKGLQKQLLFFKDLWIRFKRFFRKMACYNKNETYEKIANELHENQLFTKEDMRQIINGQPIPEAKISKNLER